LSSCVVAGLATSCFVCSCWFRSQRCARLVVAVLQLVILCGTFASSFLQESCSLCLVYERFNSSKKKKWEIQPRIMAKGPYKKTSMNL
jgi:hypothetical protein